MTSMPPCCVERAHAHLNRYAAAAGETVRCTTCGRKWELHLTWRLLPALHIEPSDVLSPLEPTVCRAKV